MITQIRLPLNSGRAATLAAAHMLAPLEMPADDALFLRQPSRPLERFFVGDLDRFVDERRVEVLGNEAGADALDLVWARLAAGDHGESTGSTAIALKFGFFGLMKRATPVIVPPVPTPATIASMLWPESSQISGPVVFS